VKLCEEQLQIFRQELLDAERELQEVESNVQSWQKFFSQFEPIVEDGAGGTGTGPAIVHNADPSGVLGFRDIVDVGSGSGSLGRTRMHAHMHDININISTSTSSFDSDHDISD
jgi:hypothetical protein